MARVVHRCAGGAGLLCRPVAVLLALVTVPVSSSAWAEPVASDMNLSLDAGLLVIAILALLAAAVLGYKWYARGAAVAALEQQLAGKDAELQSGAQRLAQLEARSAGLEQQLRDQSVALEKMAYEDDLSGLPNRRAFDEALARSVARAQRGGHPLSLLLLDVPARSRPRPRPQTSTTSSSTVRSASSATARAS